MLNMNVVCAIIYRDDKVFIARRKQGKSMASKWEFPGGKIEENESEVEALKRELIEELGMSVDIHKKLGSNIHNYDDFTINLIAYSCEFKSATFTLTDHDQYIWVEPKNLSKYDLAEADIPIANLIPD
ncbi:8-oxo-dGTP diphosphatase [Zhouia amylolytica]|uniref:8-oxo-dGTP diphosphatase n=1 Tax=Zhouia amylolytica TaxID=376730 RepID=A0A1I6PUM2_9FLAO|nr:(deoxy)nucleoside triphosphate pyrophosphohydrolase [Zhouia amylolytica]SFS43894.1 8-oxo-dGTP diphosphatase [Zhouia amylolytica]